MRVNASTLAFSPPWSSPCIRLYDNGHGGSSPVNNGRTIEERTIDEGTIESRFLRFNVIKFSLFR